MQDPAAKLLQKTEFPRLLKELLEDINPTALLPKECFFEKSNTRVSSYLPKNVP